jgi:hypothetical protein
MLLLVIEGKLTCCGAAAPLEVACGGNCAAPTPGNVQQTNAAAAALKELFM